MLCNSDTAFIGGKYVKEFEQIVCTIYRREKLYWSG